MGLANIASHNTVVDSRRPRRALLKASLIYCVFRLTGNAGNHLLDDIRLTPDAAVTDLSCARIG